MTLTSYFDFLRQFENQIQLEVFSQGSITPVLGSGVSSPVVPLASEITRELLKGENPPPNKNPFEYVMEKYLPSQIGRTQFFTKKCLKPEISSGHIALASLIHRNQLIKHVVTPNFDLQLERALTLLGRHPVSISHSVDPDYFDKVILEEPLSNIILHYHGLYFNPNIINTETEINNGINLSNIDNMRKLLEDCNVWVFGYSGTQKDAFISLICDDRLIKRAKQRINYWFLYQKEDYNHILDEVKNCGVFKFVFRENGKPLPSDNVFEDMLLLEPSNTMTYSEASDYFRNFSISFIKSVNTDKSKKLTENNINNSRSNLCSTDILNRNIPKFLESYFMNILTNQINSDSESGFLDAALRTSELYPRDTKVAEGLAAIVFRHLTNKTPNFKDSLLLITKNTTDDFKKFQTEAQICNAITLLFQVNRAEEALNLSRTLKFHDIDNLHITAMILVNNLDQDQEDKMQKIMEAMMNLHEHLYETAKIPYNLATSLHRASKKGQRKLVSSQYKFISNFNFEIETNFIFASKCIAFEAAKSSNKAHLKKISKKINSLARRESSVQSMIFSSYFDEQIRAMEENNP